VEQTDSGLIIEFSVKYGVPYDTSSVVTFRLSSNQSQADEVVDIPHDRDYVIIYPNYYVVCKVKDVKTIRQHEIKRKDFFTDELYIMPTTGIEISGEMIDMFVKKKKKTVSAVIGNKRESESQLIQITYSKCKGWTVVSE
jgi:hypothetical protein